MKRLFNSMLGLSILLITACSNENHTKGHININSSIKDVIDNEAISSFSSHIFPRSYLNNLNLKLSNIDELLPYHTYINDKDTVNIINYFIDESNKENQVFYDIYSKEEKLEDVRKEYTGLFYFKGESNKPYAIICAGGGFSYVGSIHEAMPYAMYLADKGYNAFVLEYRTGGEEIAVEDLARAITYVNANNDIFNVNLNSYSLWGGSAGARMIANIGHDGVSYYGGNEIEKPNAIIMQYTGHSRYTKDDPATFYVQGANDEIASVDIAKDRIEKLADLGVPTQINIYPSLGHGFGLGRDSTAEGWIDLAINFWQENREKN